MKRTNHFQILKLIIKNRKRQTVRKDGTQSHWPKSYLGIR